MRMRRCAHRVGGAASWLGRSRAAKFPSAAQIFVLLKSCDIRGVFWAHGATQRAPPTAPIGARSCNYSAQAGSAPCARNLSLEETRRRCMRSPPARGGEGILRRDLLSRWRPGTGLRQPRSTIRKKKKKIACGRRRGARGRKYASAPSAMPSASTAASSVKLEHGIISGMDVERKATNRPAPRSRRPGRGARFASNAQIGGDQIFRKRKGRRDAAGPSPRSRPHIGPRARTCDTGYTPACDRHDGSCPRQPGLKWLGRRASASGASTPRDAVHA